MRLALITVFSSKPYDRRYLTEANAKHGHELRFIEARLDETTAALAQGTVVCAFVNDRLNAAVLASLRTAGVEMIALRSAGFNNVDLEAARTSGMTIARVPAYSPNSVAEHAAALVLSLNRRTHKAYARVREGNFSLEGLSGFDLFDRVVGVVGTGRIGAAFARIMNGFGCKLLAFDPAANPDCVALGVAYVELQELLARADVISLHCPLTKETRHLIDEAAVGRMKPGVMLINTSRGALIDTRAVIQGLKSGQLGYLGIDVYEEEEQLFFEDLSNEVIQDDTFMRLLTFPNVMVTAHQGFFTHEALTAIAETTLLNVSAFETGRGQLYRVEL